MIPASDCKLSFYFIIIILEEPWVNTPGFFYALFLVDTQYVMNYFHKMGNTPEKDLYIL